MPAATPTRTVRSLPVDYAERVYAGVLGKIIGVYLGRPFENWSYDRITADLGDIEHYVNDRLGVPLVVSDDDITGTFTFVRALPDHGNSLDLTPEQIGQTWLNYIIDRKTILWWGGMGTSTEHTAFLRLKQGVPAPRSGSIELNTQVVAEQIGAQIFIDGWAMVAPGNPELAADLAGRAGRVSHDGAAVHAAQVIAAMESLAFVESDLDALLDTALTFIPADGVIRRMIDELRQWRTEEPDWRRARERLAAGYGYDKYGGGCHVVPNHGLIILALLWGDDDFRKSLTIVNTCGWDTDCNSGNVGCLLGLKNGLAGIDSAPDLREPVADQILLPTADGGRCISDAVQETQRLVNIGRALAGEPPLTPKDGARFHFEQPGAVQGFTVDPASSAVVRLENREGHSISGSRNLTLQLSGAGPDRPARVLTPTFATPEQLGRRGYKIIASPTLYPGQVLRGEAQACSRNPAPVSARLVIQSYDTADEPKLYHSDAVSLEPGKRATLTWTVPDVMGQPISAVGIEVAPDQPMDGRVYVDYLTWDGEPTVTLSDPSNGGKFWHRAWSDATDRVQFNDPIRVVSNTSRSLLIQGERTWRNYTVSASVEPRLADLAGLAVRVQGLERYYALVMRQGGKVALIKRFNADHDLAVADFPWEPAKAYAFQVEVAGNRIRGVIDGKPVLEAEDEGGFDGGGVALLCELGTTLFRHVTVRGG